MVVDGAYGRVEGGRKRSVRSCLGAVEVAERVGRAHSQGSETVSARERQALDDIAAVLDQTDAESKLNG